MNKRIKRALPVLLAALTLGMVYTYRTEASSAYFTTFAVAQGGPKLSIGPTENHIEDNYTSGRKTVSMTNTGDYDCYVRVKVLAPSWMAPSDPTKVSYLRIYDGNENTVGIHWHDGGDGYWYYDRVVEKGGSTSVLTIETSWLKMSPELQEQMASCDVVIVDEFTMVRYDEEGKPYADWRWQKGSDGK